MKQAVFRVVFDCNVFWQAFFSDTGVGGRCLRLVNDGLITLLISADTIEEVEDVLTRPETQSKFAQATPENVAAFLRDITKKAVFVRHVPRKFNYARDPKDEPYINLAAAADATFIISRDKDLLSLMTSHTDEGKEFRQRFRPLKVIEPLELLRLVDEAQKPY